jgi:hypothetical protein
VEDDTGRWGAVGQGHVERGGDEVGAHVVGDRPAHHGAGVQVDDGGDSVERSSSARSEESSVVVDESPDSLVFFTQFPNVIACTPILRATSAIGRWSLMTKPTA